MRTGPGQSPFTSFLVLSSGFVLILVAVGCGVAGIVLIVLEASLLGWGLFAIALLAAGLRAGAWTDPGFRAGQLTLRMCGGECPTTERELLTAIEHCKGVAPTIVGGGWGFWTAHVTVRVPCIYMHKMTGQVYDASIRDGQVKFLAGTTIQEVVSKLKGRLYRKTFWSTPSIQDITLGGWFGASCHGNSGASGKPSSYAVVYAEVVDMTRYAQGLPLKLERWDYETIRRRFDAAAIAGESKYVMVSVVFDLSKMLPSNVVVQKHLYRIEQARMDLTGWMDDAAPLRVLFVGSARRDYGLGLVWRFFDEDAVLRDPMREMPMKDACCGLLGREVHRDPHDCSAACMSLQLDGCSMVCGGWYETHKEAYNGIMHLDDANAMTPPYDSALLGLGLVHLLGIKNCEFVFKLRSPVKAGVTVQKQLEELVSNLITFFQQHWGRAELRTSCRVDERKFVFVDVGTRDAALPELARLVFPYAADNKIAMHTGKYAGTGAMLDAVTATGGLWVTPAEIFFGVDV
ncbi:MAG: hypothetical protein CMM02_05185 [Rhodopirellula sp.]|jgi:UDP-N-acetylenolpyruvoylglucosamine reductase|nr:hypothetical protein [Rhodopirellula sp.]